MNDPNGNRVIVALDDMSLSEADMFSKKIQGEVAAVKTGFELVNSEGARGIDAALGTRNVRLFLDVKLHDIPNTVEKAIGKLVRPGVKFINLHASGGRKMMEAARESVNNTWQKSFAEIYHSTHQPLIIAVTLLTSLSYDDLVEIGLAPNEEKELNRKAYITNAVLTMAKLAKDCGLDGVVASPREARAIRRECGPEFIIVTPGIRSSDDPPDDQKRTATPSEAIEAGSDYLVVGRPITKATDPLAALQKINAEVAEALAQKQEGVAV